MNGKLVLKDGTSFSGKLFGKANFSSGEVVFSTAMTGYEQSLTDPSFKGQILVFTYPMIGNYGVASEERDGNNILKNFESDSISVQGVVVSENSENFSHYKAEKSFSQWLEEKGVSGISGIDTRALTKYLRENGSQLGQIVPESEEVKDFSDITDPNTQNLVAQVSVSERKTFNTGAEKKIAVFDFGIKNNILREFISRGVEVVQLPWDADISSGKEHFDGIFFSNGPGDPEVIAPVVKKNVEYALNNKIPLWGICLGNQILALSVGAKTKKMKYGHRGVNQPCREVETKRCVITSQNHGYEVDANSLPEGWMLLWENLNDGSCEGIKHKTLPAYSVQFHPEACPGPEDSSPLFDEFLEKVNAA